MKKKIEKEYKCAPRRSYSGDELPHIFAHAGCQGSYAGPNGERHRIMDGKCTNVSVSGYVKDTDELDNLDGAHWKIYSYTTVMGILQLRKDKRVVHNTTGPYDGLSRLFLINTASYSVTTSKLQHNLKHALPFNDAKDAAYGQHVAFVPFAPQIDNAYNTKKLETALINSAKLIKEFDELKHKKPAQRAKELNCFRTYLEAILAIDSHLGLKTVRPSDHAEWLTIGTKLDRRDRAEKEKNTRATIFRLNQEVEVEITNVFRLLEEDDESVWMVKRAHDGMRHTLDEIKRLTGHHKTLSTAKQQAEVQKGAFNKERLARLEDAYSELCRTKRAGWIEKVSAVHSAWVENGGSLVEHFRNSDMLCYQNCPIGTYDLLRVDFKGSRAVLETSRSLTFPLDKKSARELLDLSKQLMSPTPPTDTTVLGQYRVEFLCGGFKIGCHFFTAEVVAVALKQLEAFCAD